MANRETDVHKFVLSLVCMLSDIESITTVYFAWLYLDLFVPIFGTMLVFYFFFFFFFFLFVCVFVVFLFFLFVIIMQ